MKHWAITLAILCLIPLACKEQKMASIEVFPPAPVIISFTKDHIIHLFPVLRENCIGLVYGERWAIATISQDKINLDEFPEKEFSISTAKALPQKDSDLLYVMTPKSVDLLDWRTRKVIDRFCDNSKTIANGLDLSKIADYKNGVAISVFNYDGEDDEIHRAFVIDDILNKKRLKEVPIPDYSRQFPVYFTPSYTIYRQNWQTPWRALDNDLNQITHPLVDLLNKDPSDSVFAVINDNMLVSEEQRHAFISTYSKVAKKDMLFLARWYGNAEVIPIPIDSAATSDGQRLVKTPNLNTISPSGKWVYFATDGGNYHKDSHYLIYLDPQLPTGFLPPFKLTIEGEVDLASWITKPEGLVVYKEGQLLCYDLSHFDPHNVGSK
jgi:hypothetical protein